MNVSMLPYYYSIKKCRYKKSRIKKRNNIAERMDFTFIASEPSPKHWQLKQSKPSHCVD